MQLQRVTDIERNILSAFWTGRKNHFRTLGRTTDFILIFLFRKLFLRLEKLFHH